MANLEKLVKALEVLKVFQTNVPPTGEDPNKKKEGVVTKKDKIANCNIIADCICSQNLRNVAEFPKFLGIAMETFLLLCDNEESDVRMVADECLNRTIKTLLETNLGRLQVELYKEIKKNGSSRCLRAALWRFADMCHLIRPQKCRPYVVNLLPCIARICRRPEEAIQETLATAMQKLCPVLMGFTNDNDIKVLIKAFLPNIRSKSATCRRTAAASLTLICQYSRKPFGFFSWLLNILLDMMVPIVEDQDVYMLLGVFLVLRHMIPHLTTQSPHEISLKGSFGVMTQEQQIKSNIEQMTQIYELLLHHTSHTDHNVITAVLETMYALLRNTPPQLLLKLSTIGGFPYTSIFEADVQQRPRLGSNKDRLPSGSDDTGLEEDIDPASEVSSHDTSSSIDDPGGAFLGDLDHNDLDASDGGLGQSDTNIPEITIDEDNSVHEEEEVFVTMDASYTNVEIGDVNEDVTTMSHSSSADTLSDARASPRRKVLHLRKGVSEDTLNTNTDDALEIDVTEAIQASISQQTMREGDIGLITDNDEVPFVHLIRLLCSRFLLTGNSQGLIADRQVRVSVKTTALGCVGLALLKHPTAFLKKLHKQSPVDGELQDIQDVLLYVSHCDPQLKGNAAVLIGHIISTALTQSRGNFTEWLRTNNCSDGVVLDRLIQQLVQILEDDSSVATRLAIVSLRSCLTGILNSNDSYLGIKVILALLRLKDNPYWLVKVELLECLSQLDFKLVAFLENVCTGLWKGEHHYLRRLELQSHIVHDVMFSLLGDADHRVRHAAAQAIARIVPNLFYAVDNLQHDPVIARAREMTDANLDPLLHQWAQPTSPFVHGLVRPFHQEVPVKHSYITEAALSRIVAGLTQQLTQSVSRHTTSGCLQALWMLSDTYPVIVYAASWGCALQALRDSGVRSAPRPPSRTLSTGSTSRFVDSVGSMSSTMSNLSLEELAMLGSGGGCLPMILSLLTASNISFDLVAHQMTLRLAGNLFAGAAYKCLRPAEEAASINPTSEDGHWVALSDRTLVPLADQLLGHLARLLNICAHILEEQHPGPPPTRPTIPSLPNAPSLSPIKRKAKGIKEDVSGQPLTINAQDAKNQPKTQTKDKEKEGEKEKGKKEGLGVFYNMPHYMKIYDVLKSTYNNYKISLDLSSSDKFGLLLTATLEVFSQILEIAGLTEMGKTAEEMLSYLKATIIQEPTMSVLCVQQLLKSLFGTNLASQWESSGAGAGASGKPGKATRLTASVKPGLYHSCFTTSYTQLTQVLANATHRTSASHHETEDGNSLIAWLRKRAERKVPAVLKAGSKADKTSIASYIRLFEPLVIKALKQYTITSSLELQTQVLGLLAQLVQLRVNYCLLDSDQIFIGFVIKQFEFIEEGQLRYSETLIPHIFSFLVLLSYEQYHSKTIIGMPKIIQLCDGIMASGQQPITHSIPALQPIVYDLFVLRSATKPDAGKDLETQREVVVSMLLRLIQYYQVLEMLIVVLHQCRKESEEKWKRLSRQVTDMVLPLLMKQQINLDCRVAVDVVHRLFESVASSVFRPVDILFKALFHSPYDLSTVEGVQHWISLVLIVLRVLMTQSKEEVLLSRLHELGLGVHIFTDTIQRHKAQDANTLDTEEKHYEPPHRVPPEEIFARLLLQVIAVVTTEISQNVTSVQGSSVTFLCEELGHLLLYISHMFQSGLYRRVALAAVRITRNATPSHYYTLAQINENFQLLALQHPTLMLQWCNLLILLNYDDQSWWSNILQTPPKYKMAATSQTTLEDMETPRPVVRCCNKEIVRRGGIILFCDYVCEHLNDAEHMTWVIINHVGDLIELCNEPPVQDFISAIQRNSAASGLFIQAIHSRCENMHKACQVKKTLHCLEAIHLSQSGALLTLLIDKFLHTTHLAVARFCDMIACRRVEMLLAESVEESSSQLPLEDLEKLLQFMKTTNLTKRHSRLASLLNKLRNLMCPESRLTLSPEKTHPLALTTTRLADIKMNKDWFQSISRDQCFKPMPNTRESAQLLAELDYSNMLVILMAKEFQLAILSECLALGTHQTLLNTTKLEEHQVADLSMAKDHATHPLLQASQITLIRHLNSVINVLPVPHQMINYSSAPSTTEQQYHDKMEDIFTDTNWFDNVLHLASALNEYLVSLERLPWKPTVPDDSVRDIARFSILCLELLHWMTVHDQLGTSVQHQIILECFSLVLQNTKLEAVIGQKEQTSWVCSAIQTVHQLLCSIPYKACSGQHKTSHCRLSKEHQDKLKQDVLSLHSKLSEFQKKYFHHVIRACDQISELVHCMRTHLNPNTTSTNIPPFLSRPLCNIVIGLARLPLVNSYARTPPLVWKMGWVPSPSGEMKTTLPPLPLDFLQEKDVLQEFIFRVNTLGWTSRQQFEETWMSLLGVLNPVHAADEEQHISSEEIVERAQGGVLAIRCITALLVQSMLTPNSGNPVNSIVEHRPRDKPLTNLHFTRCGRKLAFVRGLIEQEVQALCRKRADRDTHQQYWCRNANPDQQQHLFNSNIERELGSYEYGIAQISFESMWSPMGMSQVGADSSSDTGTDSTLDSPHTPNSPLQPEVSTITWERSSSISGLDIRSCLQFLLDLYGQLLAPSGKVPLMQLNETIKSVLCLSDVFTEKSHFEWMLDTLLELHKNHPVEDELVMQYLIVGICKAAAITGVDATLWERILKIIETGLKSAHLSSQVSTLYGCLYLLETGSHDLTRSFIPQLCDYLIKHLGSVTCVTISSHLHILVMWATSFYLIENYQEDLQETDFMNKIVQCAVTTASGPEDGTSLAVYLAIMRGLERLLLADVLSKQHAESLVKLSVDRLCLPSPQRSLASLGLMLTCMYTGKQLDAYSPSTVGTNAPEFPYSGDIPQDPESLIVAMERVTVLFDRIRKGFPYEARVITRVLPTFLADFFPPQDIMNKVIGEFLSSQQPHPQLMATVVFQVFENLISKGQQALLRDWVMLSLSNFTQRTPVAMAIWSLTCFFISASTNQWLRALLSHVIGRMGRMDTVDRRFFVIAALDFRAQLTDEAQQRAFVSTFQAVAQPDTPYTDLLTFCV